MNSVNGLNVNYYPNFKSSEVNKSVALPAQKPDTVEISAGKKKKEGMSTGMKWLLGISGGAAVVYAGLVGHRAISRPTLEVLQKDFSEIFRRNVSKEEIPEMLNGYRNILKIKNDKEFCEKAFEQVKKDYGYKDTDINLILDDSVNGILGGGWHTGSCQFFLYYKNAIQKLNGGVFNTDAKRDFLSLLFHEFQHVKQTEYCVRTNFEEYIKALTKESTINKNYINGLNAVLQNPLQIMQIAAQKKMTKDEVISQINKELDILKTKGYKAMPDYVAETNRQIKMLRQKMEDIFGKLEKFKPGDKEYEQGEKYIKNFDDYIEPTLFNITEYQNQLVEKEANHVQELSKKDLKNRLRSIWNIFQS